MRDLRQFLGRNVSYSEEKRKTYNKLIDDPLSPLTGKTMADVFVYAAVFGYIRSIREPLKKAKPQISSNAFDKNQTSVLLTIPVMTERDRIDILFDAEKCAKIIEEYANGGIDLLEEEMLGSVHDDAIEKMATMMRQLLPDS